MRALIVLSLAACAFASGFPANNQHARGYGAQQTGYGAQPAGYGAQPAGYGAQPAAGYGAQPAGYDAQPGGYGAGYDTVHGEGYGNVHRAGYGNVHGNRQGYVNQDYDNSYQQPTYAPAPTYAPVKHEDNGCKHNGDILRNGNEKCSFLECHPGDEPWYDSYGNIKLYTRVRQCPPGTAIADKATTSYGYDVLFRPIQYNPTNRVGYGQPTGYGDKHSKPTYTNSYADMTAICSEHVEYGQC